jgi:hypothetical protein
MHEFEQPGPTPPQPEPANLPGVPEAADSFPRVETLSTSDASQPTGEAQDISYAQTEFRLAQPGTISAGLPNPEPPLAPDRPKPRAIFITAALLLVTLGLWFEGSRIGWFAQTDPTDVARAQLVDLDHGRWRAAYDLFSPRYREQIPFETWRDMALTHSRMFHTREMSFGHDQEWNGGAALEAHLLAESGDRYLARFRLVYAEGRWWVDDLHWGREQPTPGQVTA